MTDISHVAQFDSGPLSWVVGEIRAAFERVAKALEAAQALGADARSTTLQHAQAHLHQADGALQMVDLDGVAKLTQAAEQALGRMRDTCVVGSPVARLDCSAANCAVLLDAFQALIDYLDELVAGAAPQPARLFPYYHALQDLLGAERIHPSELLQVDLSVTLALPARTGPTAATAATAPAAPDYAAARARFEKSLLPFLKSTDAAAQRSHALALQDTIALVEQTQIDAPARTFWLAMHSFAALVASGQLASDLHVKQLFGLVNLQIRRLSQGQGDLPEAMLRDALFFIAAAPAPDAAAQVLQRAFGLGGVVPADYARRRYHRTNAVALKAASAALARAKTAWDRLAGDSDASFGAHFDAALATLAGASGQLEAPALAQLLRDLVRAASDALVSGRSEQFRIEMAGALLFIEQGLGQLRQLPRDFDAHAALIGTRLLALAGGATLPDAAPWQDGLSHPVEQDATVAVLAGEMKSGLRQIEKVLDEYYLDATRRPALSQIDPVLHQVQGALAILDQDQAMQAALHVQGAVRVLAADAGSAERQAEALQAIAHNVGALGFFIDMLAQNADAARSRFRFDQTEGMLREISLDKASAGDTAFDADTDAGNDTADAVTAPTVAPAVEGAEAAEAELLEIFIDEAREVLAFVSATLPAARAAPAKQETLTLLRRAFHTLKGSGRMVGLNEFADAGAAIERVLNASLAESRAASADVLALLDCAATDMAAWVEQLAASGASDRRSAALVAAAAAVQDGDAAALPGAGAPEQARTPQPELDAEAEIIVMTLPEAPFDIVETEWIADSVAASTEASTAELKADSAAESTAPHAPPSPPRSSPAATVGRVFEFPGAAPRSDTVDDNTRRFGGIEIALPLYNIYLAETDELMRVLTQDFGEWRHEPLRAATPEALTAAHTLAGTSATVGFNALRAVAHALEMALQAMVAPAPLLGDAERDLLDAAVDCARHMLQRFAVGELAPAQPGLVAQLVALREQLAHRGAPAPQIRDSDSADALVEPPLLVQAAPVSDVESAPVPVPMPASLAAPDLAAPLETLIGDDLDDDLLPVFLEEAADLLPAIGNGLRQWQQQPADTGPVQGLLRALHTVKGSARMAGAMRLGQHAHEIETQIENMVHAGTSTPAAFDELLANYDHALALLDQLQQPATGAGVAAGAAAESAAAGAAAPAPARATLVRVRADILDRLVNQAGEVSITRSKLENQVGTLKFALSDFSDNLARLKHQLREVDMQAESQIASRMAIASEREFDPLEFDRFTRLQELTRMMAESVSDVASFHDTLSRTVEAASADLVQQSRLTRELQRDLMRVRMVPFASLSERLFRVARQSAKELDKRVNLDIRGSGVEIDRGVLEQMAAPFEHLLRNAIVHGIESRERRAAAGKAETGELLIQVSQVGNEVIIEFSDDGAGLDLARIRAKARSSGLLGEGDEISDQESFELIFAPGFSTAESLTELAGRGVGMDVVRAEAQALGGTVAIASDPGKGAHFTIHLPLTLAVTQVVLTASAGSTYALPSILIEQVLQLKAAPLAQAHADGVLPYQGEQVALHYLPALLGEPDARPPAQRSSPVLLLKSGADRLAVQVDEVIGNREVVIKNIGPQLSRMVGIAGATVLGSGEIVLILNPVALAPHRAHQPGAPAADADAVSAATAVTAAATTAAPARASLIMVVDDSLTVRRVTQRMLEREGYQVVLAKDGVDALEKLQERIPELMLVDIEMPRMDGFDLTRNIRGNDSTRAVPIIMITSRTADKHRNYALDLGVNAYFGKPFQEDVLLAAIAGLLDRALPA
ncbi:MAG: Hpt domain-containing protein [Massilia sp.]|nr:Hpt domain-containing protein [Massilia sp.]